MMKKRYTILYLLLFMCFVIQAINDIEWNFLWVVVSLFAFLGLGVISLAILYGGDEKKIVSLRIPFKIKKVLINFGKSFKRDYPNLY